MLLQRLNVCGTSPYPIRTGNVHGRHKPLVLVQRSRSQPGQDYLKGVVEAFRLVYPWDMIMSLSSEFQNTHAE